MEVVTVKSKSDKIKRVRKLILSAGHTIGSVHFIKRSDGIKRRMCYRLHTYEPTYASKPSGKRKNKDLNNNQVTVFDCNNVRRNRKGLISGRGDWRTIPLEGVERVCVKGVIYKIME